MAIGRTNAVGKAGTQFSLVVTVETGSLVTATKGTRSVSGTAVNGSCVLTLPEAGTWTVTATRNGQTSDTKTVSVVDSYAVSLTFFSATITVTAPSGATVTLKKGGSTVDSKTSTGTAVFTVYETGEYTVEATQGGQSTSGTVNVTASTTSYAITLSFVSDTLNENSWDTISEVSDAGEGANYWAIGDRKQVTLPRNYGEHEPRVYDRLHRRYRVLFWDADAENQRRGSAERGGQIMNLHKCILTRNECYTSGRTITPRGVMVHSTGANNPTLRRYVQPDDGLLGDNRYDNDWNRPGIDACVHAFIGELADGSVATYQTLPWNWRGWHAASGPNGSANNTHISFEICEDGLDEPVYFAKVYKEAAELTAYLCELYDLDPEADGVVICHSEGHARGIASNHGDVMHWFPRHGKNMDDFRAEVARLIKNPNKEDELDMTKEELISCAGTGDNPSEWAREHTEYCKQKGIFAGDGAGNYGWQQPITREAAATIIHRALEVAGLADSIPDA